MAFDPKRHLINLKGKEYLPVSARLIWFRQEHPDWSIITTPIEINMEKNYAIFSASIMNPEGKIIATGTKMETIKDFGDFLEKAETGSVGRALAMCGFGTQFAPEFAEGNRPADSPIGPSARFAPRPNGGGGNFNNRPGPTRPNAPMNGNSNGNGANEPRPPMPMSPMEDERPFDEAAMGPPAPRERPIERPALQPPSPQRIPNEAPTRPAQNNASGGVVRERVKEPEYTDPGGDDEPDGPDDPFADDFVAPRDAAPRPSAPINMPPVQLGSDKPNPMANSPVCSSPGCTAKLTPGQVTLSMQKFGKLLCVIHQKDVAPIGADRTANSL